MDKETIIITAVIILVIIAVLYTTGIISINIGKTGNSVAAGSYGNMPEECKAPAGQDINAWKEHLGHHENTKYCLDYYK